MPQTPRRRYSRRVSRHIWPSLVNTEAQRRAGGLMAPIVSRATVVPAPPDASTPSQTTPPQRAVRELLRHAWQKFEAVWGRYQVSHRGKYSVERLLALQDYNERTSALRAIAVCLLTPVPALVVTLLLESIPLAPPSKGWRDQGAFWIRLTLSSFIMVLLSGFNTNPLFPRTLRFPVWRLALVAAITAVLYATVAAAVSSVWAFPIPFLFVLGTVPFVSCEFIAILLIIDLRPVLSIEGAKRHFDDFNAVSTAISVLLWIYPAFNAVFRSVDKKFQLPLLLALPVFKFVWKNAVVGKMTNVEDLIPETMIFSVELFNALYLTNCMQSAGTPLMTVTIITMDAIQAAFSLYRLSRRTTAVQTLLTLNKAGHGGDAGSLLQHVVDILNNPATREQESVRTVLSKSRIGGSVLSHQLSDRSLLIVRGLHSSSSKSMAAETTASITKKRSLKKMSSLRSPLGNSERSPPGFVVNQALKLLFQCEFMVLGEYIECAIPLLYGVYLPILRQLHNGVYFAHAQVLSTASLHKLLLSIISYWILEVLSLVLLHFWLRKRFGFSALHLLAFVLEEHVVLIQSKMILMTVFALQFTIAHLGADFSFQFPWLKDPTVPWWIHD